MALLIFHWKLCFLFWLWGQISKTQFYACCQTEALTMRSFPDQSHGSRGHIRPISKLTEICLGVLMCPALEFSFSWCCSLCSEVTSTLWPLWGKVFLLLGSGNFPGRYQHGSNATGSVNFHVHLSRRAVSLAPHCPHCGLQAATVPLTLQRRNSTPGRKGVV